MKMCDYRHMVILNRMMQASWEEKILDYVLTLLTNKKVIKWYLISHIIPFILVFLDGLQCYKEDNPVTITCSLGYFAQYVISSNFESKTKQKIINFLLKYCCLNPNFRNAVMESTLLEYALFEEKNPGIVTLLLDTGASLAKAIIPYRRFKQVCPKNISYPGRYMMYYSPLWWYIVRGVWPILNAIIPGHVPGGRHTKSNVEDAFLFFADHDIQHSSIDKFCKNLIPPSLEQIKNNAPNKKYFIKRGYWKFDKQNCDGYLLIDIARHYLDFLWFLKDFTAMKDENKTKLKPYILTILDNIPKMIEFYCPYVNQHKNGPYSWDAVWDNHIGGSRNVISYFSDDKAMYKSNTIKIPKKDIIAKLNLDFHDLTIKN